jgi:hypothetical protein
MGDIYCDLGQFTRTRETLAQLPGDIGPFLRVLMQGQLAVANAAEGDYEGAAAIIQEMIDLLYELPFTASVFYIVTCIAALCGYRGDYETAVKILALPLHNEKIGGFALRRTEYLLDEFRPRLAPDVYEDILLREENGRILELPPAPELGRDVQSLTFLNDLLTAVTSPTYQ